MTNPFETILYEKRDAIAFITLNRPQVLNVYNVKMRDELFEILDAITNDDEVKAVVMKGAGDKAFCAGADLTEFLTAPSPVIARKIRWERDVWGRFLSLPQPVIAALHGFVLGDGIEIALCCDLRIAADNTRFGLPEVKLGIIPAAGATQTLPRTIGRARALDMLLSGVWLNAQEAYKYRLVNKVVPKDTLISTVEEVASKIASYDARATRAAKQAINRGLDMPLVQGFELERRLARSITPTQPVH
jgi:enoyl-CoA hydratase